MKLHGLVFHTFYQHLTEFIYNNELSEQQKNRLKPKSSTLWIANQQGNNKSPLIHQIYFPDSGTASNYLSKKKTLLKITDSVPQEVQNDVLYYCLEKIGYNYPRETSIESLKSDEIKARILVQSFVQAHLNDFFTVHKDHYEIFDAVTKKLILKDDKPIAGKERQVIGISNRTDHTPSEIIPRDRALLVLPKASQFLDAGSEIFMYEIYKVVREYFLCLKQGYLRKAFNLWYELSRENKWESGYKEFSQKVSLSKIQRFNITHVSLSSSLDQVFHAACYVQYDEVLNLPYLSLVSDILNTKVSDTTAIALKLQNLNNKITPTNEAPSSNLTIQDLISYNLLDHLESIKFSDPLNAYQNKTKREITRIGHFELIYEDEKWKITNFRNGRLNSYCKEFSGNDSNKEDAIRQADKYVSNNKKNFEEEMFFLKYDYNAGFGQSNDPKTFFRFFSKKKK